MDKIRTKEIEALQEVENILSDLNSDERRRLIVFFTDKYRPSTNYGGLTNG